MAGEAARIMQDCAQAVDIVPNGEPQTWRFFAGSGHYSEDKYRIQFISRGSISKIDPSDLGYLAAFVTVDAPNDEEVAPRIATYEGPAENIPDFTSLLKEKLLLPIMDDDPLENFNGSLSILGAAINSAISEGKGSQA